MADDIVNVMVIPKNSMTHGKKHNSEGRDSVRSVVVVRRVVYMLRSQDLYLLVCRVVADYPLHLRQHLPGT